MVISIKHGKISSTTLLRKLTHNSNKNRFFKAFQGLGKAVRTIFLLEYTESVELRETITEATNKVETYHKLSKWIEFATDFMVRTNDPHEMKKAIKYNSLITNSLSIQNVIDISSIIQELRREKRSITKADLAFLSPYLRNILKDLEITSSIWIKNMNIQQNLASKRYNWFFKKESINVS